MKIELSVEDFKNAIKKINKLKVKCTLNVLNDNVLLIAKNNQLTLINSDLDITLKVTIPCDIEKEGKLVISKNDLKLITKIKESYIKIDNNEIITEKKRLQFKSLDINEYPKIIQCNIKQWDTSKDDIDNLLQVTYAMAKDNKIPTFAGVFIDKNKWIALDGYRMVVRKGEYDSNISIIASSKQINLLKKLVNKNTDNVKFLTNKNSTCSSFKFDNVEIISKNIEEDYINYNSIIPNERDNYIKVNKNDILEELEFMEKIAENNYENFIKLINNFNDNELIVNCETKTNILNSKIKMLENRYEVENNFTIGLNCDYLEETIKNYKNEEELYIIYGDNKIQPIMITNDIYSDNIDLVLPLRY